MHLHFSLANNNNFLSPDPILSEQPTPWPPDLPALFRQLSPCSSLIWDVDTFDLQSADVYTCSVARIQSLTGDRVSQQPDLDSEIISQ